MGIKGMLFGNKCGECGQKFREELRASPDETTPMMVCAECHEKLSIRKREREEEEARKREEEKRRQEIAAQKRAEEDARRAEQEKQRQLESKRRESSVALLKAAEDEDVGAVRRSLKDGADVNCTDDIGRRPLHSAACTSSVELNALLIDSGAEVDGRESYGQTPLHWLCARKHSVASVDVAQLLIQKGANVNADDKNDLKPLHCAAMGGRTKLVEFLLANGADAFAISRRGRSAFYYALEAGAFEVQRALAAITDESSAGLEVEAHSALEVLQALKDSKPIIRLRNPQTDFNPESLPKEQQVELARLLKLDQASGYTMREGLNGAMVLVHLTYAPKAPVRKSTAS